MKSDIARPLNDLQLKKIREKCRRTKEIFTLSEFLEKYNKEEIKDFSL